jgi:serine/threonine protein kinase
MNEFDNQDFPIDKTFVEGDGPLPQATPLTTGVRFDSTVAGRENPYAAQRPRPPAFVAQSTQGSLPDGTQQLPIGSGVIVDVLGMGGMAKIYKIWNEKLEIFRAVKILLPGQSADLINRFETEAKITAKLHHPNIVEIYSVGEWNSLPFLEMELIEGDSLMAVINNYGRLPARVCTAISILIARALTYAHSQEVLLYGRKYQGVIHRDLKPANIMISNRGDVKLMDFGIARPTETSLHTVDGNIVGTLQYLSPEQMDGTHIDARTDIYSFGAILYEMLTGAKTFPQTTISSLMKIKALNAYQQLNDLDFYIPPSLIKITQTCLAVNKESRFESAAAMEEALAGAYKTLTDQSPQDVMHEFIANPQRAIALWGDDKKRGLKIPLLPTLISAGVLCILGGVAAFVMLNPPEKSPVVAPAPITAAPAPAPVVAPAPIAAAPAPAPVVAPVKAPPAPDTFDESEQVEETPVTLPPKPIVKPVRPPVEEKKTPIPVEPLSAIDQLKSKYGSSEPMEVAEKAVGLNNYRDAIIALETIPANASDHNRAILGLVGAYINIGDFNKARQINSTITFDDAYLDLMRGKMEEAAGNDKKALTFFQSAFTKPSIMRSAQTIRKDALFFTAEVYDRYYQSSPSAETRLQALNAWNNVKKGYLATPDHPRFKVANQKLSAIH